MWDISEFIYLWQHEQYEQYKFSKVHKIARFTNLKDLQVLQDLKVLQYLHVFQVLLAHHWVDFWAFFITLTLLPSAMGTRFFVQNGDPILSDMGT